MSLDELNDADVGTLLKELHSAAFDSDRGEFERVYFKKRLELAAGERTGDGEQRHRRPYVAVELRRFLARGTVEVASPRLVALERWARRVFEDDIRATLRTGLPHKTILFTSWVGEEASGEAALLHQCLSLAFDEALEALRGRHGRQWENWKAAGGHRLERLAADDERELGPAARALARDELTAVFAGSHRGFRRRLSSTAAKHLEAVRATETELDAVDKHSIEARALQRRLNDMRAGLDPWVGERPLRAVERYTGGDERSERDRAASAFRQIGPPWALVASQVGSEGIDLQTYTHRIVHYDLEWNPARMEQREGRGDRVGRVLPGKIHVVYCLVPRTYDERMFHQLVARDRWHGVLLGKPAKALEREDTEANLLDRRRLRRMRLRLAPR